MTQKEKKKIAKSLALPMEDIRYTEVLSQEEIDQLLTAINGDEESPKNFNKTRKNTPKIDYIFDQHTKINSEFSKEAKNNILLLEAKLKKTYKVFLETTKELQKELEQLKAENERIRKIIRTAELFD